MPATVSRHGRGRRTMSEINMVPFIDVMLVLLIIFMVTAPLISPSTVNLPSMGHAAQQTESPLQLVIQNNGQIELAISGAPKKLAVTEVGAAVKAAQAASQKPDGRFSPVVISADKDVRYESVVQVMDQLQRAGVQRVGLSVQTKG